MWEKGTRVDVVEEVQNGCSWEDQNRCRGEDRSGCMEKQ